jgi:hypothetical protein
MDATFFQLAHLRQLPCASCRRARYAFQLRHVSQFAFWLD